MNPVYAGDIASLKKEYRFKIGTIREKKPQDWIVVEGRHEPLIDRKWYSVKKKYKLNVNFFHNTIPNLQLILNSLALSNTCPHIHLGIDIHNDCVS